PVVSTGAADALRTRTAMVKLHAASRPSGRQSRSIRSESTSTLGSSKRGPVSLGHRGGTGSHAPAGRGAAARARARMETTRRPTGTRSGYARVEPPAVRSVKGAHVGLVGHRREPRRRAGGRVHPPLADGGLVHVTAWVRQRGGRVVDPGADGAVARERRSEH